MKRRLSSPITKTRGSRVVTPIADLRVGDVIRLLTTNLEDRYGNGPRINQSGIVRERDGRDGDSSVGVEFFRAFEGGHTLGGNARDGHGWYVFGDARVSRFRTTRRGRDGR